jgi:hypothetical protein
MVMFLVPTGLPPEGLAGLIGLVTTARQPGEVVAVDDITLRRLRLVQRLPNG